MPLDRDSYYADAATLASLETITAAMADKEADRFDALDATLQVYNYRPADAAALSALAGMRTGDRALQVDTGVLYRYNGSAWKEWESDWVTYTPGSGGAGSDSGFTIGTTNAVNTARYKWEGGRVRFQRKLKFGTAGSPAVSATVKLGLPMNAAALTHPFQRIQGDASLWDSSGSDLRNGGVNFDNTSVNQVRVGYEIITGTAYEWADTGGSKPWTWGASDAIAVEGIYDPA